MLCNAGLRNRRFERVEIHADQIDRRNAVRGHGRHVFWIVAHAEQSAVHFGVQRLDAPVHHLGKAGDVADVHHRQTGLGQGFGGTARGHQLEASRGQRLAKRHQALLIRNTQNRTAHEQKPSRKRRNTENSSIVGGIAN